MCAAALLTAQLAGCSGNAELDAANAKIASLEAQLASEKAKNAGAAPATSKGKDGGKRGAALAQARDGDKPAAAPAPVADPSIGKQWNYSSDQDKMTGNSVYGAGVSSTNTVSFDFPYAGAQHGSLDLRSSKRTGKDVMFSIQKGQILCHSYQDCTVLVRFDDEKPVTYSAVGPADNSTEMIFLRGYDKFVGKLRKAKVVRISVNIYKQGAPVFEFDVSGFNPDKLQPPGK